MIKKQTMQAKPTKRAATKQATVRFPGDAMRAMFVATMVVSGLFSGCAFNALGRGPSDLDLQNDGTDDAQSDILRRYEVVYDRGLIRRPGADPAAVAADIHVAKVDDVSSPAWSDDTFNYLSSSDAAAEIMEDPAVGFDQFAHSGTGEIVLIGTGMGTGIVAGAITWFLPTTVVDGIQDEEQLELYYAVSGGFAAGLTLGLIVASAYTYIVPAVSTPFATSAYRRAARVFNADVEERILELTPDGDPPALPHPAPSTTPEPPPVASEGEPKPVEPPTTTAPAPLTP